MLETALITAVGTIIAAIIVSAVTLHGVSLNLAESRKKSREDRLLNLKRDVYLEACDAIAELLVVLTTLADPTVQLKSAFPLVQKFAGTVAKIHLLGSKETVALVIRFQRTVIEIWIAISQEKAALEAEALTAGNAVNLERYRLILELSTTAGLKMAPDVTEITLALKRELDLPVDERWYREQMKELMAKAQTRIDGVIAPLIKKPER